MANKKVIDITERLKGGYPAACDVLGRPALTLDQFSFLGAQAEGQFAIHKIETFIEALNEGHEFDWNDEDEYKYYPWWDMETYDDAPAGSGFSLYGVGYGYTVACVGARLSTRTRAHAEFAAEIMEPEYRMWIKKLK